jgi:hypothetical protein
MQRENTSLSLCPDFYWVIVSQNTIFSPVKGKCCKKTNSRMNADANAHANAHANADANAHANSHTQEL